MESETLTPGRQPNFLQRVLASAVPVVWIAISYVDPGKWAATVEGGARFGFDVVSLVLMFNCVAILCQYLSACIAVVTGKDLAQICSEEYDNITCVFLGVQAEISIIALDLMMVLGTAYGLNAIFGIDLFNCVFLTGIDAILFPFLSALLENRKAKFLSICLTSIVLLSYVFGVLISQPESSFSMGGMLTKLSGESAYALMSLLGASIAPHNFYLHSSIVQQDQGPTTVTKGALCHDHFIATLCIFSGIFLVNCMLMNLAANVFYSTGLVLLTFQDALSLLDQVEVFRSSITSLALILIVFFSNQIIALTWSRGRQVIIHDFFGMDIPCWLHRATIRIIAIIPALYCVWNSGAEEMIFGNSDWVNNLKWSIGGSVPISYLILLATASVFLCLMLWLATTPLKSASSRVDAQVLNWEVKFSEPEAYAEGDQIEISEAQYQIDKATEKQVPCIVVQ
ncbi:Ethylene-insensitive protein 2 [Abeliophyllum distichum]|uniref:Ethylene-insensitive protein 2 n=1 Tax=Abeliophyllum distichum TaxID=126358 RepID=A0ABD1V8E9_9LAMI